jgi:hypothetical protein
MELRDAYRILEVPGGAGEETVRDARKTLAKVWHPDRHAHDPELAKKAQQKTADINAAFEVIRAARFPSTTEPAAPLPASIPPVGASRASAPPPVVDTRIEFVPRRRVRWPVMLLLIAALGAGAYFAVLHLGKRAVDTAVSRPSSPPTPNPAPQPTPAPAPTGRTFDLGASPDEVRAVQGEPTTIQEMLHIWHYDTASVTFDRDRVVGYWNTDGTLHIALRPMNAATAEKAKAAGHYTIGASKDEVIGVEGTPQRVDHVIRESWYYGRSGSIDFDDQGRVIKIDDFSHELRGK